MKLEKGRKKGDREKKGRALQNWETPGQMCCNFGNWLIHSGYAISRRNALIRLIEVECDISKCGV